MTYRKPYTPGSPLNFRVAVIIPCYNEEITIARVVDDFKTALPDADVFVFDNNSTDSTVRLSRAAGARIAHVALKGKGNVVRQMFADVEADIYIMVDGDNTYDAASCQKLVDKLVTENLDMVVGCRASQGNATAYPYGHRLGNRLLTGSVRRIFGGQFTDMLSGYRAFSRRYVKSFPAVAKGFETETELTAHALELRMPYGEITTPYVARPDGSKSKLCTYRDGLRILWTILRLYMNRRPLKFFGILGILLAITSIALITPIVIEYLEIGLVPRLPTAVLATALMLSAMLSIVCGLLMDVIARARHDLLRLAYLSIPCIRELGAK